mgnify:CR=1 FL=1
MVEVTLALIRMKETPQPELRRPCREWATKYVGIQRDGFKRLGVNADWDHPYLTYIPNFEAGNVEIFRDMYSRARYIAAASPSTGARSAIRLLPRPKSNTPTRFPRPST